MLRLILRLLRHPKAAASLDALIVNLKQLDEISNDDGTVQFDLIENAGTPERRLVVTEQRQWRWLSLARCVSMEFRQVQRNLGLEAGNPHWTQQR
jgi:hypothetical protein